MKREDFKSLSILEEDKKLIRKIALENDEKHYKVVHDMLKIYLKHKRIFNNKLFWENI